MTSTYTQKGCLAHQADSKDASITYPKRQKRRRATVYDAVAGRVTNRGSTLLAHSTTSKPLSAQQLLFQRIGAPTIYAEKAEEYNFASKLPHGTLPDSDLLKSLHTYASDYYARTYDPTKHKMNRGKKAVEGEASKKERLRSCRDFRSMDETALLAIGVLMEEMMKSSIGETGDLAFTVEGARGVRKLKKRARRPAPVVVEEVEAEADYEDEREPEVTDGKDAQAEQEKERKKRGRRSKSNRRNEGRRKSKKGKT